MTPIRDAILSLVISAVLIVAAVLSTIFLKEHPVETWPSAAQTALNVAAVIGGCVLVAFVGFIVYVIVAGVIYERRCSRDEKHENHRFANESTPDRIVIARYTASGERHTALDVSLDRQLWLVPTADIIAFDLYRVAYAPFAALLDHAPLYDKEEGQTFAEATKRPSIVLQHERLWTQSTAFGKTDRRNGLLESILEAFGPLIASGAVIAHIDIDMWKPKVPQDAKFRTHWKRTPPAEPAAA